MPTQRLLAAGIATLALALPSQALAGTVTQSASAVSYTADPATGADERVSLGIEAGNGFVTSERGVTSTNCTDTPPNRVDCGPTSAFFVNFLGFNDVVDADQVTGGATLDAHGGGGDDGLSGT